MDTPLRLNELDRKVRFGPKQTSRSCVAHTPGASRNICFWPKRTARKLKRTSRAQYEVSAYRRTTAKSDGSNDGSTSTFSKPFNSGSMRIRRKCVSGVAN